MRIIFSLIFTVGVLCLIDTVAARNHGYNTRIRTGPNKAGRRFRKRAGKASAGIDPVEGRVGESGSGCDYVVLSDLLRKGTGCVNGAKFVITPGKIARRQYVIINDKPLLLWVKKGTKFTDCTAFTDKTASISCKEVPGLASIDLGDNSETGSSTAPSSKVR